MFNQTVEAEFFDLQSKPDAATLELICDVIDECGFVVNEVKNFDTTIHITVSKASLKGSVKINRMMHEYTVVLSDSKQSNLYIASNVDDVAAWLKQF